MPGLQSNEDSFEPGVFEGLVSLETLIVDNFRYLRTVHREDLSPLVMANVVELIRCSVSTIEQGSFQHLTHLSVLDLGGNKLQACCSLDGLTSLERLNLSNNRIESLDGFFNSPTLNLKLKYLNLSGNLLESLPANSFASLSTLRSLNLSCNRLERVGGEAFNGLFTLQELDLSSNDFKAIGADMFRDMINLKSLDLTFVKLKQIDEKAFLNFRNKLVVKTNLLRDVSYFILSKIKSIQLVIAKLSYD